MLRSQRIALTILVAATAAGCFSQRAVSAADLIYPVTFWSRPYYRGEEFLMWLRPHICYRLGWASDQLNSMATYGQCIDVYTRDDCAGGMFRVDGNQTHRCARNMGECDMNDRISSMRICPRCRNSCYYQPGGGGWGGGGGQQTGNLEEIGDEEVCLCRCNCPVPGPCVAPEA